MIGHLLDTLGYWRRHPKDLAEDLAAAVGLLAVIAAALYGLPFLSAFLRSFA